MATLDRKQKSLLYMQKASNELAQLKTRVNELESELAEATEQLQKKAELEEELAEAQIQIQKRDERIRSLENTLRLFYDAIEKDEERAAKAPHHHEHHHHHHQRQMSPEESKRLQFQNDMEKWRSKEKRKHSEIVPSRKVFAPISSNAPAPAPVSALPAPTPVTKPAAETPAMRIMKAAAVFTPITAATESPAPKPSSTPKAAATFTPKASGTPSKATTTPSKPSSVSAKERPTKYQRVNVPPSASPATARKATSPPKAPTPSQAPASITKESSATPSLSSVPAPQSPSAVKTPARRIAAAISSLSTASSVSKLNSPARVYSPARAAAIAAANATGGASNSPARQPLAPISVAPSSSANSLANSNANSNSGSNLAKGVYTTVIKHNQSTGPSTPGTGPRVTPLRKGATTGGLGLYHWCKQSAAPYTVTDFTKSWADGMAICQLLNNIRPGSINMQQVKPDQAEHNIRMALDTAEKLGVTKLIDPEDFAQERNSMMTYLSQVYSVLRGQENMV